MRKILFFTFLTLYSCSAFFSNIYGVKNITAVDKKAINTFYGSINFGEIKPITKLIDTTYFQQINKSFISDSLTKKAMKQPVQIWYLNQNNQIVFSRINCDVPGGLGNLKWNYDKAFDVFPPISSQKEPNIEAVLSLLNQSIEKTNTKYKIIIFWSNVLEKQAKVAIEQVIKNLNKTSLNEFSLFCINTDSQFIHY